MSTTQERYPPEYAALHALVRAIQHERIVNPESIAYLPIGETSCKQVQEYAQRLHARAVQSGTTGPALTLSETESQDVLEAWLSFPLYQRPGQIEFLQEVLSAADGGEAAKHTNLEHNVEVINLAGADQWYKNHSSELGDTKLLIEQLEQATQRSNERLETQSEAGRPPSAAELQSKEAKRCLTAAGPLVRAITATLARPKTYMHVGDLYDSIEIISKIRSLPLPTAKDYSDLDLKSWTDAHDKAQSALESAWDSFTSIAGPSMRMSDDRFLSGRERNLIMDDQYMVSAEAVRDAAHTLLNKLKEVSRVSRMQGILDQLRAS